MNKIEFTLRINPIEKRMLPFEIHAVPAHVRDLEPACAWFRDSFREAEDLTLDDAEASRLILFTPVHDNLGPQTDSKKGFPPPIGFHQGCVQLQAHKVEHGRSCGTDPWENDPLSSEDNCRAGSDHRILAEKRKSSLNARQVTGLVINNRNHLFHWQAAEKRPSAALPSFLVVAAYVVYASLLGISGALHLDVFDQPAKELPKSSPLVSDTLKLYD